MGADVTVESELARLRRELERLRAENVRLSRLLDLRGQDTAPPPEQLSAAVAPPGLVHMASPVADKLALCLVLTRRVAHVEALTSALASRGHQALVLQGGMSTSDRRATVRLLADAKAGDGVLVVGTTPFIGEGFDAPALDTLFLAAPVSYDGLLIQCAGRVIRAAPGKAVAEVHDYHDRDTPILAASLQRRMPGYRALGFAKA